MADPIELSGWKAIAAHLGVTPRTAQEYEKTLGLPVHHQPGAKGRVFANPAEIDAWRKRVRNNGGASAVGQNRDVTNDPSQDWRPSRRIRLIALSERVILAVLVLAAGGLVFWGAYRLLRPVGRPAQIRVEGDSLIAADGQGREVWRHSFPIPPRPRQYPVGDPQDYQPYLFLDHGGKSELLYVYYPVGPRGTSTLYCFGSNGTVRWTYRPGRPVATPMGRQFDGVYDINLLATLRRARADGGRIIAGSHHNYSWPYRVVLLTTEGKEVAEYWHPGWIAQLVVADLDGDGTEEVLLGGVNNSYEELEENGRDYGATLVVLNSKNMSGMGQVRPGDDRLVLGVPPATEEAVLLFRWPTARDRNAYNRVFVLKVPETGHVMSYVGHDMACNGPSAPCAWFDLDRRLQLLNLQPELNLQAALLVHAPKGASPAERLKSLVERTGGVLYLKNTLAVTRVTHK